jgi:oxygen-independent coproporphyrinogen-3 oxidase
MNHRSDNLGIYIHIPFCRSKCYYCDFNSYAGREYLAGSYFDALYREITVRSEQIRDRHVCSIFIGGGTPSLVDTGYITKLIDVCRSHFHVDDDAEITMESNPGTLTHDKLQAYRDAGVNRLSIGLQAWQDSILRSIGRIHTRRQFVDNVEAAVKCGFDNINADLIFGLPGQTLENWMETLEAVTGFDAIKHISCYSLKIEEGTVFGDRLDAGLLQLVDDELDREMYHQAVDTLAEKGYRWYEISNFAKPGFECRHNLLYWKAREYAGFGAGAHSYLDAVRFSNVTGIEEYIRAIDTVYAKHSRAGTESCGGHGRVGTDSCGGHGRVGTERCGGHSRVGMERCGSSTTACAGIEGLHENFEVIGREEAMSEYMILGLRLVEGVNSAEFEERFGEKLEDKYGDRLGKLVANGLLTADVRPAETDALDPDHIRQAETAALDPDHIRPAETDALDPDHIRQAETAALDPDHIRQTETDVLDPDHIRQAETDALDPGQSRLAEAAALDPALIRPDENTASGTGRKSREIAYKLTRLGFDLANSVFIEFI